jgi:alkylation response protein AidB-like acyl-CoA dehydrogenase
MDVTQRIARSEASSRACVWSSRHGGAQLFRDARIRQIAEGTNEVLCCASSLVGRMPMAEH